VVAGGEHVGALVEELGGDGARDAEAGGRILGVDDRVVDVVGTGQIPEVVEQNAPSRTPHDVADEQNSKQDRTSR
jgi:hypothetical protein